jgi:NADH dehydrogenase
LVKERIVDSNGGKKVLIIGGGFGGMAAARELDKLGVEAVLADRNGHHLFQPLLYQVATAGLAAPSVAAPLRQALRDCGRIQVVQAEVEDVDGPGCRAKFVGGEWTQWAAIIVASGSECGYFGRDEWAKHAPGLKTLEDAMDIRGRVLSAFEKAEVTPAGSERDALMTFAIVGGGPTGVELAGSLSEIARHALRGEFRAIDPSKARIVLIEGGAGPLSVMGERLSARATSDLESMGVEVICKARVVGIDEDGLSYDKDGVQARLPAKVVLWAAGVKASPLAARAAGATASAVDRGGRAVARQDLSLDGAPRVFVIGDAASVQSAGKPVPGLAPAAKQMGALAAKNVAALLAGGATTPFEYADHGSLATIGRHRAVVDLGWVQFSGYGAWVFWLLAHIFFLIGWRNRLIVMSDWAWAYWTKQRWSRVWTGQKKAKPAPAASDPKPAV